MGYPVCSFTETLKNFVFCIWTFGSTTCSSTTNCWVWRVTAGLKWQKTQIYSPFIQHTHTRARTPTHTQKHTQALASCPSLSATARGLLPGYSVFPVRSVKGGEIQFSDQAVTFLSFYSLWAPVPASLNACLFWEVCLPVSPDMCLNTFDAVLHLPRLHISEMPNT